MNTLAIENRIALLRSRKSDNANIIRKLERKLRNIKGEKR